MNQFMPHGMSYLWDPELLWLHALSDAVIALSSFIIPLALLYVVRKRRDLPYRRVVVLLAIVIIALGLTHALAVWNIWNNDYWISGGAKVVTALASLAIVFMLIPTLPRLVALRSPAEMERLNQDLQGANDRLSRRDQQIEQLNSVARLGSWEWDLETDRIEWSDQMYRNYGMEPGVEMPAREWFRERIHPDDLDRAEGALKGALESGEALSMQYRIFWPDGTLHHIRSRSRVIRNDAGKPIRLLGTSQDVTAEESARETGLRREAMLAEAQAIAHFGSWEWEVGENRVVWSDEMYRIYGYDPGAVEIDFETYLSHVHPEDQERVGATVRAALERGEPFEFEERIVRPGGEVRTLESKGYVYREGGRPVRMIGICHDVTEARVAQAARAADEERFRRIVETAHEGVWTIDVDGVTTYVNGRMAELLGYSADEMVGRSFYDFMDEEARVEAERNLERRRKGIEERHEFRLRTREGRDLWTCMSTSPLVNEGGEVVGALAMVTDMTESRETELSVQVLARTGEILGTSLEPEVTIQQIADLVVEAAAEGCILDLVSEGGRIERSAVAAADPGMKERLRDAPRLIPVTVDPAHPMISVLTRGETVHVPHVDEAWLESITSHDGSLVYLKDLGVSSFLAVPVTARGRILGALLCLRTHRDGRTFTARDVGLMEEVGRRTGLALDNARLFEALTSSEAGYRFLAENSTDMITRHDPEGICRYASPSARELTGYEPHELEGRRLNEVFQTRGQPEREREAIFDALRSGRVMTLTDVLRTRGGEERPIEATVRGIYDQETGEPLGFIAISRDITDRVRAEEELRKREAQLAEAQAIASVGSWEWDVETDRVTWSRELYRIYGVEPGSIDLTYDSFLTFLPPQDRSRVEQSVRAAYESTEPFEYEHRLIRADGEVRRLLARGRVETDERGRVVRMTGTGQDVTDRVRAQEALRRSEENYRMLADYSSDIIMRFSPEGICTYASPASRIVMGMEPEELMGEDASRFIHPDDLEAVAESRRTIFASTGPHSVMCRLARASGGWVWVESTGQGVRESRTDQVESIIVVARDVTESVKAANTIRLLEQVAVAANEATSVRDAMQAALRLVCDYAGWRVGHVYVPVREASGELASTDIWHMEDPSEFKAVRQATESMRFKLGEGLPGRVLEQGKPVWIHDVLQDPGIPRAQALVDAGVRAAFAFPVRAGGETLAVLEFFPSEPGPPEDDLLEIMGNVGAQVGQVLQRHRTEEALRSSEHRFRALAETASEVIVSADDTNHIVYANRSVEEVFGWRPEDLVGQSLTVLMPERFRTAHLEGFERFLETREGTIVGRPVEMVGLRKDGQEFPVELSIAWWEGGDGLYFTGIIRDITERKRVEEALTEKMEELARSNAELGLFTYVASHDLREPLRTVGSNVQLVTRRLGDGLEEGIRRPLDYALSGVRRMQALIDDLLIYSRVGTEGKPIMPLEAGETLSEALENLRVAIEESGARIEAADLPRILGDHTQVVQLFQNLISNAVKFRREGESPQVRVSARREGRDWVFSVEDNGIGIDPAYSDHVFTIFQRLHSDDRFPGTGIGLAVCRKIVERHGGRIWVESNDAGGATFRFTLPAPRDLPRG